MEIHIDAAPDHLAAELEELLVEHESVNEQGLHVEVVNRTVTIRGAVATHARADAVCHLLVEQLPGWQVVCDLDITAEPPEATDGTPEEVS